MDFLFLKVGYGDKVPSSYAGKLIAAICSFIGISFFALPAVKSRFFFFVSNGMISLLIFRGFLDRVLH